MPRLRFSDLGVPIHLPHTHVTRLVGPQKSVAHTHDFYEIVLILQGQGTHYLNRERVDLLPGHLIAIQPSDCHCFSTPPTDGLVFVNVAVSRQWWEAFHLIFGWPKWDPDHRSAVLNATETKRLGVELSRSFAESDLGLFNGLWHRALEFMRRPAAAIAMPPAWLEVLRSDLGNLHELLGESINFWQQRSGCSAAHLSRCCRRFYGTTFRELVCIARIERAKYLLRTCDRKITGIGYDCGFENMANFHRSFARQVGMTPNAWRKRGNATVPLSTGSIHERRR